MEGGRKREGRGGEGRGERERERERGGGGEGEGEGERVEGGVMNPLIMEANQQCFMLKENIATYKC